MKEQCEVCEYRKVCFWALITKMRYTKERCKQGRAERVMKPKVKDAPA